MQIPGLALTMLFMDTCESHREKAHSNAAVKEAALSEG